jgi:hypothetical protein
LDTAQDKLELYSESFSYYDEAMRVIKRERDEKQQAGDVAEALI